MIRMTTPLPIDPLIPDIVASLEHQPNAVVVAPPGAGKTTRLPPALVAARFLGEYSSSKGGRQVVLLQPRRVAARAAASRIAEERNWILGAEVGYQIRFENRTSPHTRLRVVTEGILTRQIQSDPFLEGVGCVILDEFHERSIHTDLALALLREIQMTVRGDLRVVVMSATMNPRPVAEFLGDAPVFESEGRLFPVEVEFQDRPDPRPTPLWEKTAAAIRRVMSATLDPPAPSGISPASSAPAALAVSPAHLLVFLPGIGEIRRVESEIQDLLRDSANELHILHSSVSNENQDRALRPSRRRKIILATNIAETSITIDGVRTVIDGGLARVLVNDTRLGIDRLELRRISRASADQRAGRAGRTGPGRCIRLWSRAEDGALEAADVPEIHRVDLASTLLALKTYGVRNPADFRWFEPPRPDALARAERLLWMLGAADADGKITPLGRDMARLPLHPRIARMLMAGAEQGRTREAATLAALLSERDILADAPQHRRRDAGWVGASDVLDRLDWIESRAGAGRLDPQAVRSVERIRDDLIALLDHLRGDPGKGRRR